MPPRQGAPTWMGSIPPGIEPHQNVSLQRPGLVGQAPPGIQFHPQSAPPQPPSDLPPGLDMPPHGSLGGALAPLLDRVRKDPQVAARIQKMIPSVESRPDRGSGWGPWRGGFNPHRPDAPAAAAGGNPSPRRPSLVENRPVHDAPGMDTPVPKRPRPDWRSRVRSRRKPGAKTKATAPPPATTGGNPGRPPRRRGGNPAFDRVGGRPERPRRDENPRSRGGWRERLAMR